MTYISNIKFEKTYFIQFIAILARYKCHCIKKNKIFNLIEYYTYNITINFTKVLDV